MDVMQEMVQVLANDPMVPQYQREIWQAVLTKNDSAHEGGSQAEVKGETHDEEQ